MKIIPLTLLAAALMMAAPNNAISGFGGGAIPLQLTGTWAGSVKCKGANPIGEKDKFEYVGTFDITQFASDFGVDLGTLFSFDPRGFLPDVDLCGRSAETPGKPGQGSVVMDSVSFDDYLLFGDGPVQTVLFDKAKTFEANGKGVTGQLKGSSIWGNASGGYISCKWKFDRIDDTDPAGDISDCLGLR